MLSDLKINFWPFVGPFTHHLLSLRYISTREMSNQWSPGWTFTKWLERLVLRKIFSHFYILILSIINNKSSWYHMNIFFSLKCHLSSNVQNLPGGHKYRNLAWQNGFVSKMSKKNYAYKLWPLVLICFLSKCKKNITSYQIAKNCKSSEWTFKLDETQSIGYLVSRHYN